MRLNARQVFYQGGSHATILLSIEDVTDRRILEREKDETHGNRFLFAEEAEADFFPVAISWAFHGRDHECKFLSH